MESTQIREVFFSECIFGNGIIAQEYPGLLHPTE
jgi:hypothetical protein